MVLTGKLFCVVLGEGEAKRMKFQFLEKIRAKDIFVFIKNRTLPILIAVIVLQTIFILDLNSNVARIEDSLRNGDQEELESKIEELEGKTLELAIQCKKLKYELDNVRLEVGSNTSNISGLQRRLLILELNHF
jgi:hypothetical protein